MLRSGPSPNSGRRSTSRALLHCRRKLFAMCWGLGISCTLELTNLPYPCPIAHPHQTPPSHRRHPPHTPALCFRLRPPTHTALLALLELPHALLRQGKPRFAFRPRLSRFRFIIVRSIVGGWWREAPLAGGKWREGPKGRPAPGPASASLHSFKAERYQCFCHLPGAPLAVAHRIRAKSHWILTSDHDS